ncbi:MAG TPA: cell wall-binding protein [Clostridium sp.]|nr:cell wall-binding protein [Clostridium sp.]
MIKRMNKLTALLAAATAVASIAPAGVHAADYKRVKSEDGTVYNAVAFDGKFYVDGNVVDEDTDATYFLSNGKYNELADIDTGSSVSVYGEKYLNVDNGDYFIDLSNGKVVEDDIEEDTKDELALTLRKELRNVADDRYSDADILKDVSAINEINKKDNSFGPIWYETSFTSKETGNKLTIYTDAEGNYIDADYNVGKVKVTVGDKNVTLNNTEDEEELNKDSDVSVKVAKSKVIAQDNDYIYRIAELDVTITGVSVGTDVVINGQNVKTKENGVASVKVIQKISKAQASDDIDGAKYAKSVTNYAIAEEDNNKIKDTDETLVSELEGTSVKYSAFGNKLVSYTVTNGKVDVQTINFKTTRGNNHIELEDKVDTEIATAFDVDVDGNLWRLEDGYIYKFDNVDDWEKVYRVDGSMNKMDVYNSENIVVWNEKNEAYSIIGSKEVVEDNTSDEDDSNNSEDTVAPVVSGWNQAADGTYTYVNADGTLAKGWFQSPLSGKWFYMDPSTGVMQTGWLQSPYSGKWFYMDPTNGDMQTGWLQSPYSGKWFYMDPTNGDMQTGWVQSPYSGKWFYMDPTNGDMQTGWIQSPYSGKWYYMDASGAMVTNTTVNGYVLGADGAWIR